ncbi:DUF998 domain-containing protein [Glycomyces sp. TRM65418]|uniref:DUF998 domain-containing protein n=1 Tax=Glycomyces sp. TRM65418 TaxID=2867006 RepID=UPI001CE4F0CE|nr:DUF998 domain-containing protein [Glycomyces sp. TRM65418]MCC3763301.1 DUF998 domain-containing protein [Glycomyces sp. TRM65418]QZD57300.1 DUF998 domain-containing protein [Glycomyces sp. TRM65418]
MTTETATAPSDAPATRTAAVRGLLACGVAAGPLFVGVTVAQAATREGFDPVVHPLSLLSLGDLGWLQIANFVVSGLLALAGAAGLRHSLAAGPASKWGPRLVGLYGIALVWGGVFVADPAFGYPAGAPDGAPAEQSWHSILHAFAAPGAGLTLLAACFVFARRFRLEHRTAWRVACYVVPALYLVLTAVSFAAADYRWMLAGGAFIWLWASAVTLQQLRSGR